jgi:hypothetical protein
MIISKTSKKAASEISINKIIVIILVLLVVVAVILWATKTDILGWIKNLPGYQQANDTTKEVPEDTIKALGYQQIGILEDYGNIIKIDLGEGYKTLPLYAKIDSSGSGTIYLPKKRIGMDWLAFDLEVGKVLGEHFVINWTAYNQYKENSDFDILVGLLDKSKVINNGGEFGLWRLETTEIYGIKRTLEELTKVGTILNGEKKVKLVDYLNPIKEDLLLGYDPNQKRWVSEGGTFNVSTLNLRFILLDTIEKQVFDINGASLVDGVWIVRYKSN